MTETVTGHQKAPRDIRSMQCAFLESLSMPTLSIKPLWHDEGFLIGFEVWDGLDLVGYIPYGAEFRNVLFDAGIG
jgi:hypothetical protein